MATRLAVLGLCCALSAAIAPTNFEALLGDSYGDSVDIKLQWNHSWCNVWKTAEYNISYTTNGRDKQVLNRTTTNNITLLRQSYWTTYDFTLSTNCTKFEPDVHTQLVIEAGNPSIVPVYFLHANSTNVEIRWNGTVLPRVPDWYNVTVCQNDNECQPSFILQNTELIKPIYSVIVDDLDPLTEYTMNVTAVIQFKEKRYFSASPQVPFATTDMVYPIPENFTDSYKTVGNAANGFTMWKLHHDLALVQYNITLLDPYNQVIRSGTTYQQWIDFTGLPIKCDLYLTVLPIFEYHNRQYNGNSTIHHFKI